MEAKGLRIEELRATNYVRCFDGKEGEVSELGNFSYFSWIEEDWSGIPLTEEWLLKFGFKYDDNWHYTIGENPLTMDYLLDITWIEGDKYPFYRNGHFKIKYVHQLQNLFFSLTGEELTVSS